MKLDLVLRKNESDLKVVVLVLQCRLRATSMPSTSRVHRVHTRRMVRVCAHCYKLCLFYHFVGE